MAKTLHILIVEDSEDDALLIVRALEKDGYEIAFKRVETEEEMRAALDEKNWDIILADYKLPTFSGLKALEVAGGRDKQTPFILVSGTVGESAAVECIKAGADNYIIKGSLMFLGLAVQRAIDEAKSRKESAAMEKALMNSANEWNTTFNSINDAVCLVYKNRAIKRCNYVMAQMFGRSQEDIIGENCCNLIHGKVMPIKECPVTRALETRKREIKELQLGDKWVSVIADPIFDSNNEITSFVHIVRDITEHKTSEIKMRRLATIIEQITEGVAFADLEGNLQFVNHAWAVMHGYETGTELLGKHLKIFHTEEQLNDEVIPFNEDIMKKRNKTGEIGHKRKDGTTFPTRMTTTLLEDKQGKPYGLAAFAHDITEIKKATESLEESRAKYRALFDGAPDGIIVADVDTGQYIQVNSAICKKLGYSEKEIKDASQFKSIHPKEDIDRIKDLFYKQASGEIEIAENIPFVKKDGKIIYFDVSSVLLEINGQKCVVALLRDISDRKRTEQIKTHLMRDVSHGLKTPIAISQMALYVYKDGIKRGDVQEALEAYDIITNNLNLLRKDIDNILTSTTIDMRKDELERKKGKCSLKRIVEAGIKDVRTIVAKGNVKTRTNISSEANRVAIHERDAKILFNCLMDNAIKFTGKGSIFVSSRKNKDKVELKVKDTGCGMTGEQLNRVFEKFYKRHPAVEGTGLGLSICKDIVEMYNGEIEVKSEGVGKGTTVLLRLPKG